MKRFLWNIVTFSTLTSFIFLTFIVFVYFTSKANFNYPIAKEKNILLVGDSHIECAIDDKIMSNTFNLAQSGKSYFYSYLKVRELTRRNSHINTIVVGYSYKNLFTEWFAHKKYLTSIQTYLPLMDNKDIYELFKANPVAVLRNLPKAALKNFYRVITQTRPPVGGYLYLDRDKLKEAIQKAEVAGKKSPYSNYEANYLIKIYDLCQEKKLKLILLNTPIHTIREESLEIYKKEYCTFANEKLPNAILINHSNFSIPSYGYGDLRHLNFKGAKIYSEFLFKNQFKHGLQQCEKRE